jgi:hypothetical protein
MSVHERDQSAKHVNSKETQGNSPNQEKLTKERHQNRRKPTRYRPLFLDQGNRPSGQVAERGITMAGSRTCPGGRGSSLLHFATEK